MIVVMQEGATEDQVQAVIDRMVEMDFTIHRSTGMVHIVLGGVGPEERVNPADFEEMEGVQECRRIMSPFKLASRHFKPGGSVVRVGGSEIGGPRLWLCAGLTGASAARMARLSRLWRKPAPVPFGCELRRARTTMCSPPPGRPLPLPK